MVDEAASYQSDERDAALARVREAGAQVIDLQFSDITGGAKSLTIPADILESVLERGYRFDGSALTGLRQVELTLALVPDPNTLIIFPEQSGTPRRAQLCCSVRRLDTSPFPGDPRSVLIQTLEKASAMGYEYRVSLEIEYYLISNEAEQSISTYSGSLSASAACRYFDAVSDRVARVRNDIITTLSGLGISTGGAHHETGPGQEEFDFGTLPALDLADQMITARKVIRSIANKHGFRATFMPKPYHDGPGSGMHLFQSFIDSDGEDLLRGSRGEGLSRVGRGVIGGQLAHAAGMALILCPTVNSYKRLNAGHRAPRHATWARVSQASLIRVPTLAPGEKTEIELRSPDAMANPYLAFAVTLAAALDGVRTGEEPPEPLDEGLVLYDDAELQRRGIPRLPGTLGDALSSFAEDRVVQDALGDFIVDQLLTVKKAEWEDYRRYVSPWELAHYGDA
ncbi:type I glutamate--ammonia ligase [soil metagenome]